MALNFTEVPIPLVSGVNKQDEFLHDGTSLVRAENAQFEDANTIKRASGFSADPSFVDGESVETIRATNTANGVLLDVTSYPESLGDYYETSVMKYPEVVEVNSQRFSSYDATRAPRLGLSSRDNFGKCMLYDAAVNGALQSVQCVAYAGEQLDHNTGSSSLTVVIRRLRQSTGEFTNSPLRYTTTNLTHLRVVYSATLGENTYFYVITVENGVLKCRQFTVATDGDAIAVVTPSMWFAASTTLAMDAAPILWSAENPNSGVFITIAIGTTVHHLAHYLNAASDFVISSSAGVYSGGAVAVSWIPYPNGYEYFVFSFYDGATYKILNVESTYYATSVGWTKVTWPAASLVTNVLIAETLGPISVTRGDATFHSAPTAANTRHIAVAFGRTQIKSTFDQEEDTEVLGARAGVYIREFACSNSAVTILGTADSSTQQQCISPAGSSFYVYDATTGVQQLVLPVCFPSARTPRFALLHAHRATGAGFIPWEPMVVDEMSSNFVTDNRYATAPLPQITVAGGSGADFDSIVMPHIVAGNLNVFRKEASGVTPAWPSNYDSPSLVLDSYSRVAALQGVAANGITYLAGAAPRIYDGVRIGFAGFVHPPVLADVTNGSKAAPNGYLVPGETYKVRATYILTDSNGVEYESEPSAIYTFATGAYDSYAFRFVSSTTTPSKTTDYPISNWNLRIQAYRTTKDDYSRFYRDQLIDVTNKEWGIADDDLIKNVPLYSEGEARNATPPMSNVVVEHQNRLFSSDGYTIRYTKNLTPGYGTRWYPPSDYITVPDTFGRCVGLVSMDEALVVFCEKKIGVVRGEGPSNAGLDGSFTQIIEVVTGYPMKQAWANSILLTDEGIWFQTTRGLRLLTRGLSIGRSERGDVGSEVDLVFSGTVNTAIVRDNERMFITDDTTYVFDTDAAAWTTRNTGGKGAWISYAGDLSLASTGVVTEGAASGTMKVDTGWLSLAGLQGFQRVTHLMLLGQFTLREAQTDPASGESISVEYATDFDEVWTTLKSSSEFLPASNTVGAHNRIQFEVQIPKQKCQSIRFRISTTCPDVKADFRITGLRLRVGAKKGFQKLDSTRRF